MRRKLRFTRDRWRALRAIRESGSALVVYQMGKVGSSSLHEALGRALGRPILKVHRLRLDNDSFVRRSPTKTALRRWWARRIEKTLEGREVRLITAVREPVARNVSDFFQTFGVFAPGLSGPPGSATVEELHQLFLRAYPHHAPEVWFDQQVREVFGIDVYRDPSTVLPGGSRHYRRGRVELLVYRLEDQESAMADIAAFAGVPPFSLPAVNQGTAKGYADLYRAFRSRPLPASYTEALHATRYYQFFYGPRPAPLAP